jgi:hypothetical protein
VDSLQSLAGALGSIPEVRPEAVAGAATKLESGSLLTADAVQQTASLLLG